jgi:hypothetical protein
MREAWIAGTNMGHRSGCSASHWQNRTQIRSGCFLIVSKHTAQSFPAFNFSGRPPHCRLRCNQSVADPLVVSLSVKMVQDAGCGFSQRSLPEKDHMRQALFFDRSHKPLHIGIQVGRARRQAHRFNSTSLPGQD